MADDDSVFFLCCDGRLFVGIANNHVMGLAFCYGAIIADDRIGISPLIDRDTLSQHLYMAGIGNGTVEPIQIVVLYFLVSRRFHGVPHAHDL